MATCLSKVADVSIQGTASLSLGLVALTSLAACAGGLPYVLQNAVGPQSASTGSGTGTLIVYSATYAPVVEQSEYPIHTDYTVATLGDHVIERVSNGTGSFFSDPAKVSLPAGEYHVRAQYDRGGFVTIPVVIEAGKITTLDLDSAAMPRGTSPQPEPIRLPDGRVVGWRSVVSR